MTKREKLLKRLGNRPGDFTFSELTTLLGQLGYQEIKKGKTAGSRRAFYNADSKHLIRIHKPHPKEILKKYQVDYIINELKRKRII